MTEEKTQIADHFPSTAIQNNEIQFNFFLSIVHLWTIYLWVPGNVKYNTIFLNIFFLVAKKKRVKKGKSKKVTEGGTEPESVAENGLELEKDDKEFIEAMLQSKKQQLQEQGGDNSKGMKSVWCKEYSIIKS